MLVPCGELCTYCHKKNYLDIRLLDGYRTWNILLFLLLSSITAGSCNIRHCEQRYFCAYSSFTQRTKQHLFLNIPICLFCPLSSLVYSPCSWLQFYGTNSLISLTLLQKGDLRFFGDPFPETLVKMSQLQRRPKLGIETPAEVLLTRNILARLKNLAKKKFWKLWWCKVACRYNKMMLPFWLPVAIVMIFIHTVPLFSIWSNFTRKYILENIQKYKQCSTREKKICREVFFGITILLAMFPAVAIIYTPNVAHDDDISTVLCLCNNRCSTKRINDLTYLHHLSFTFRLC